MSHDIYYQQKNVSYSYIVVIILLEIMVEKIKSSLNKSKRVVENNKSNVQSDYEYI
jgi:hypothetical protein